MINFDIQGSLLPNPLTMLIQLLATLIIFIAVKKLLWKPVRNILEKRSDTIQNTLDSAFEKNDEASKNLSKAKQELEDARASSGEIIEAARKEASSLKEEIVKKAKQEASDKLADADRMIENKKKEAKNELYDEVVDVALAAVSKLLEEKATSENDQEAIKKYIKEVKDK